MNTQLLEAAGQRMMLNLRDLRKAHRVTQEQMAEGLNVTQATVSKWESGDSSAPAWAVAGYVKLLGLSREQGLGIFGERPRGSVD